MENEQQKKKTEYSINIYVIKWPTYFLMKNQIINYQAAIICLSSQINFSSDLDNYKNISSLFEFNLMNWN